MQLGRRRERPSLLLQVPTEGGYAGTIEHRAECRVAANSGREVVAINFPHRANACVAALMADLPVLIATAIIKARMAMLHLDHSLPNGRRHLVSKSVLSTFKG